MPKLIFLFLSFLTLYAKDIYFYKDGKKSFLAPVDINITMQKAPKSPHAKRYFLSQGRVVGVANEILIKTNNIEKILKNYPLTLVEKLGDSLYLLTTKEDVFESANRLYEEGVAELAHPNFSRELQRR